MGKVKIKNEAKAGSNVILPELGQISVPEDGVIQVPESIAEQLCDEESGLGWSYADAKKKVKEVVEEEEEEEIEDEGEDDIEEEDEGEDEGEGDETSEEDSELLEKIDSMNLDQLKALAEELGLEEGTYSKIKKADTLAKMLKKHIEKMD